MQKFVCNWLTFGEERKKGEFNQSVGLKPGGKSKYDVGGGGSEDLKLGTSSPTWSSVLIWGVLHLSSMVMLILLFVLEKRSVKLKDMFMNWGGNTEEKIGFEFKGGRREEGKGAFMSIIITTGGRHARY